MLKKKTLPELILPLKERTLALENFLTESDPTLKYDIWELSDPYGPAIVYPEISIIVASEESRKGCDAINRIRADKNLPELAVHIVGLQRDPVRDSDLEEDKVSSSSFRMRLLGETID